jgi:hypothetical protein
MSTLHKDSDVCFSDNEQPQGAKVDATLPEFLSPWPWCPYRDVPHDTHLVNEGNTWCAGVPGQKPVMTKERLIELRDYWQHIADNAHASIESSQRREATALCAVAVYEGVLKSVES